MAQTQVPVRLSDDVLKRVDKHIERMQKVEPGIQATRAAAARALILHGLAAVEKTKR